MMAGELSKLAPITPQKQSATRFAFEQIEAALRVAHGDEFPSLFVHESDGRRPGIVVERDSVDGLARGAVEGVERAGAERAIVAEREEMRPSQSPRPSRGVQ